jgi:peptide/nickel transport system permease protein
LRNKVPVRELIAQKLPVTMQLASMAIICLPDRNPCGNRIGGQEGHGLGLRRQFLRAVGHPTPNFWLGIMLIFLFSIKLAGCRRRAMCR